jgi:hypothetical protein
VFLSRLEQTLGRGDVVAKELFGPDAANLRVPYDEHLAICEAFPPVVVGRQIGAHDT